MSIPTMTNVGTSYLFWLIWLFGGAGFHRFYNRKFFTGFLWLFTWGLFGVGQIIDLALIPNMVEENNLRARARLGLTPTGLPLNQATIEVVVRDRFTGSPIHDRSFEPVEMSSDQPVAQSSQPSPAELMVMLLKAAQARGGKLSVTQGVLDTECGFAEVEATLKDMVKTGYVTVCNDPDTGIVLYDFVEL
ncbi:MAG: TM2 domain-containing protein [Oculatellaceae cyanobacterium bins.114]|nr:TM2 domain-containing protein [Oculatellaceae cyanobacterium bins.114]